MTTPSTLLHFNEQSFQALLKSMPQIVFIANQRGETLYLNPKWYDYTGNFSGDTLYESWERAVHPEDLEAIYLSWNHAVKATKSWTHEYRLRRYDGIYRWHLGRSVPHIDEDGKIKFWIGTVTDIEDQKLAERTLVETNENLEEKVRLRTKELRQTNSFLDTIIENIPNMIFVKDAEDLKFVRFNRAGEELLGLSRTELIGKGDYDFFPPQQAEAFQAKDRDVINGKVVVDIPEEPISTKTGLRILHTKKLPVFDTSGSARYLVGISEDITESKKIELERLQYIENQIEQKESLKTAERFRFLSEASALLSSSLDLEKILKDLTAFAVPKMADWCSVELLQPDRNLRQISVAHKDPEKAKWANELRSKYPRDPNSPLGSPHVVRTGKAEMVSEITPELLRTTALNEEHFQAISSLGFKSYICVPIRSRGRVLGTLSLVTTEDSQKIYTQADLHLAEDLGERVGTAIENAQLYKEASQLNRVKDEFLATLSHELRTPLNVILGHAEILDSGPENLEPGALKTSIDAIYRNAKTQARLIDDLLDVSSIITGKVSYKPAKIKPIEIVTNIVESLKTTAVAKNISLTSQTQKAPLDVYADATRLHQIIWNLISNAIKFTPVDGQVTVVIETHGDAWQITVKDTGRGIDPEFLPYVFDRFRQEDSTTTRRYGGLGLGLSIVRHLAELHGGTVEAESLGKDLGATFRVRLPLKSFSMYPPQSAKKTLSPEHAPPPTKTIHLQDVKILLIEDSEDSRSLIRLVLDRAGAKTVEASSAAEARERLKSFQPEIIVSDVGMAEESGTEFIKKLRASQSPLKNTPAIALTAYVRPEEKEAVFDAGFQAHVGKPVSSDTLLNEIQKLLH